MAIKFQFNKTSMNELNKQLKVRLRALPTLKNKESALRVMSKLAKDRAQQLKEELEEALQSYSYMSGLWNEFEPNLISVDDVILETVKVAGIKTPELKEVIYSVKPFDTFSKPMWYTDGVEILKRLAQLGIESEVCIEKARILDFQRKKTTQ